jgi:hypothetical protein
MKIALASLVSRDMRLAARSVNSLRNQWPTEHIQFPVVVIINSFNQEFVRDFSLWCQREGVEYRVTLSNGTPARGKNEVLRFFRESDYDGISMVDGDDMYYPTTARQIERHLLHHPGTDIIIVKPSDQVSADPNGAPIRPGCYAQLWGQQVIPMGYTYGPGVHGMYTTGHIAARNQGGHIYYSRKIPEVVQYDEEQLLGEDLLFEFQLLRMHQDAKVSF